MFTDNNKPLPAVYILHFNEANQIPQHQAVNVNYSLPLPTFPDRSRWRNGVMRRREPHISLSTVQVLTASNLHLILHYSFCGAVLFQVLFCVNRKRSLLARGAMKCKKFERLHWKQVQLCVWICRSEEFCSGHLHTVLRGCCAGEQSNWLLFFGRLSPYWLFKSFPCSSFSVTHRLSGLPR